MSNANLSPTRRTAAGQQLPGQMIKPIKPPSHRPLQKLRRRSQQGLPATLSQKTRNAAFQFSQAGSAIAAYHGPVSPGLNAGRKPAPSNTDAGLDLAPINKDLYLRAAGQPLARGKNKPAGSESEIVAFPGSGQPTNALTFKGDFWAIRYAGKTAILEDTRGLRYIALLIRDAADSPLHAAELVALAGGGKSGPMELEKKESLVDSIAENRFIQRLEEIGFARASASACGNYDRVAELDEELDHLTRELRKIRGARAGHSRYATFNSAAEKARKAVSKAISETVSKINRFHDLQALANHLRTHLQKGQWLSYNGGKDWDVHFQFSIPAKAQEKQSPTRARKPLSAKAAGIL